ncbi:unnamed protein product [Brachionus calyciflorus]|uniref:PLAT domain-containing protein n=1 Tax=Brachionus calyciflorus TaxID=104777 RepID=A0A814D8G3_9BILA|nr:unnamed protein product [Brachionus calyciflorus]
MQQTSVSNRSVRTAETSSMLPRIKSNKLYRAPPTPPLDKLYEREKSFKLDGIAVGNISTDYSRANPKLGSAIPPYNSLEDKSISSYLSNFGVPDLLKKTGMWSHPESIEGNTHDKFNKDGAGAKYLELRNKFGNGHHPENTDGHSRYQGEQLRVMISYNNMYGYRRNIPKLRTEPPSTFSFDPRWYDRIKRTYSQHYTEDELMEHFKHTYVIGYPFWDNNYNHFHPTVKYKISVKTSKKSPEDYNGNLGINIVSRNFDTGFIKLDENIALLKEGESRRFFKRGQIDVFQFEEQDIRTISAIILSRDAKGDEVLYLDYVDVEIIKLNETQSFRFPFDGWIRKAKQDRKTEELKARFGKKNSVIAFPNEKPKYEYKIVVAPQMTKNTEYTVEINYDIRYFDEQCDYRIELSNALPNSGKIFLRLTGTNGESNQFEFSEKSKGSSGLIFDVTNTDIGEIKYATILYENQSGEYDLKNLKITDPDGSNYLFEIDSALRTKKERILKGKIVSQSEMEPSDDPPSEDGKLYIKLQGQGEETNMFCLKNALESKDGVHKFNKIESFIGAIQNIRLRYEGSKNNFCKIKSIKISSNKGHEFNHVKSMILKNYEETVVSDKSKNRKTIPYEPKKKAQIMVKIFGEKMNSDMFPLKEAESNEDDLDEYSKTLNDLGKIKNVYVKYVSESDEEAFFKFIEIIDPRENSFKFLMDINLQNGSDIMLPRKSGGAKKPESDDTEENETISENEQENKSQTQQQSSTNDTKPVKTNEQQEEEEE